MKKHLSVSAEQLESLRRSGEPIIVPLEGNGEVVVQDADAYRRMLKILDELDLIESARICEERWQAMQSGAAPGVPLDDFLTSLRMRLNLQ